MVVEDGAEVGVDPRPTAPGGFTVSDGGITVVGKGVTVAPHELTREGRPLSA